MELYVDPDDDSRFAIVESWERVAAHKAAASRIPPAMFAEFQPLIAEPPTGRYYAKVPFTERR